VRVEEDGNLTIDFGEGHELRVVFVFSPAQWGEARIRIGANVVVEPRSRRPLLELAARHLGVSAPEEGTEAPPSTFFVAADLTSLPQGFVFDATLVEVEASTSKLTLHLSCRWDGEAWLAFRGPRGAKTASLVLRFFERNLAATAP
jgi:hypothetical protein